MWVELIGTIQTKLCNPSVQSWNASGARTHNKLSIQWLVLHSANLSLQKRGVVIILKLQMDDSHDLTI